MSVSDSLQYIGCIYKSTYLLVASVSDWRSNTICAQAGNTTNKFASSTNHLRNQSILLASPRSRPILLSNRGSSPELAFWSSPSSLALLHTLLPVATDSQEPSTNPDSFQPFRNPPPLLQSRANASGTAALAAGATGLASADATILAPASAEATPELANMHVNPSTVGHAPNLTTTGSRRDGASAGNAGGNGGRRRTREQRSISS